MKILSQHDLFIVDVQYTEEVMINMIGCIYEGGAYMSEAPIWWQEKSCLQFINVAQRISHV